MSSLKRKIFYSFCWSILVITVLFWHEAQAATNSVTDCLGDEANCTETDNSTNQTEENTNDSVMEEESSGSLAFQLIKMFFALLLVLALIYFLLKFLNKRNKLFSQVKALENLGGISVGQNKSIQIIRIGNKLYLVGVGDNVEMLQEITDEALMQDILRSKEGSESLSAGTLLSTLIPGKKANNTDAAQTDFKSLYAKELDNLKKNRKKMIKKHKEDSYE